MPERSNASEMFLVLGNVCLSVCLCVCACVCVYVCVCVSVNALLSTIFMPPPLVVGGIIELTFPSVLLSDQH